MIEIKDRHTGKVLGRWHRVTQAANALGRGYGTTLPGMYLGHRVPWDLRGASLRGVDLSSVDLTGRDLADADLTGADLTGARYDARTKWPPGFDPQALGAVLVPVDLRGAKLPGEDLTGADLAGADLRGADLTGASLRGAALLGAKVNGAVLCGADLREADLTDADLTGAKHDARTRWPAGFDLDAHVASFAAPASEQDLEQLVSLLKALADKSRLRLLGLLSDEEVTVEELAAALGLKEPTVSHHLARLKEHGLVGMRQEGARHLYRLDRERLTTLLRDLPLRAVKVGRDDLDSETFDRKVLSTFFEGDRLKEIPARYKKQAVILARLVEEFKTGVRYPEAVVNETLKRFHPDCATLRRQLIDHRFMARKNNVYWRLEKAPEPPGTAEPDS